MAMHDNKVCDSIIKSYAIILRDEIAFAIIHYKDDEYILIDPHVEYCGIMSKNAINRYATYDGIWDFNINILTPIENMVDENIPIVNVVDENIPIVTPTNE